LFCSSQHRPSSPYCELKTDLIKAEGLSPPPYRQHPVSARGRPIGSLSQNAENARHPRLARGNNRYLSKSLACGAPGKEERSAKHLWARKFRNKARFLAALPAVCH